MLRLGWFSTGRDEAARQLLQVVHQAIQEGKLEARIAFVFMSRRPGESSESDLFIHLVKSYSLPLIYLSHIDFTSSVSVPNQKLNTRASYDQASLKLLKGFDVDLCILAGYMLIVSPKMCRHYSMINLHPAAPGGPKGTWQQVIWQLIEQRATASGAMMHLVTPELDQGPPLTYCTYSLRGPAFIPLWKEIGRQPLEEVKCQDGENNALFRLIRQEGLKREFPLILNTLKAFSRREVRIDGGAVLDKQGNPISGYDLTAEINKVLGVHHG